MIYKLLDNPRFYSLVQRVFNIGGGQLLDSMFRQYLPSFKDCENILDVGCGPKSKFVRFGLQPFGFDLSKEYIQTYLNEIRQGCVGSIEKLPFKDNFFDGVLSFGLFHHVPDVIAKQGIAEMLRVCSPNGQVVIWDAVLPQKKWLRPQAYLMRKFDRGNYMRSQQEIVDILPDRRTWQVTRYTYNSISRVELIICSYSKNED